MRNIKVKVLFLASNPNNTDQLALDEEIREITSKIRAAEYRDSIDLNSALAVRPDDLLQMLNQHMPQIVHFSGHGSESGEVILTSESGESKPVSSRALKALFTTLKDNIKVVVLNCCYSKEQAKAITQVIDCAVGMSEAIGDKAAIIFASSFYRAIGFGRSVKEAFDQGVTALLLEGIPEENTPELLVKDGVNPSQVIPLRLSDYINMALDPEDANEELKGVLITLYADKRTRGQTISRADLFCILVRRRIDMVDPSKLPRMIAMLDDFDQRLNAEPSAGKFEVTDAVKDLLLKAQRYTKEVGKDKLGVIQLMEMLLEDPGENIKKGLNKHGFTAADILLEMKYHSSDIFSNDAQKGDQP